MIRILQALEKWVKSPDFNDPDQNQQALYIQSFALIVIVVASSIGVLYAALGRWVYVVTILLNIAIQGIVILAIRFKKLRFAFAFFLVSTLASTTLGIMSGGGIHSTTSVLFPMIILFASLLLNRRQFILYCLACLACIALIVAAERRGITVPYVPDPPELSLFIAYGLMIAAAALVIRVVTETMQSNLLQSRQSLRDLAAQKAMLDHVGQAIVACDAKNVIVYWNQAAADMFGWTAEEAIGCKSSKVIPARMTPETGEAIRSALLAGEVWSGEMPIRKRDGAFLPVIGTIAPLRDERGLAGWIAIAADLTGRERAELLSRRRAEEMSLLYQFGISLASGKDLYSALLALQTEILKLIQADAFFVAIYDEATDVARYPIFFEGGKPAFEPDRLLHEWPGLTGAVIFSGKTLYLPDTMLPEVEETYRPHDTNNMVLHTFLGIPLAVDERVIGMLSVQSREVDAYTPDQAALAENIAVLAAGAIDKARLLDRLQQELAERKRSEEKYRDIFNNSIEGIFQSTEDGRFLNVNPAMARIYGYASPEDMIESVKNIGAQVYVNAEQRNDVLRRLNAGERLSGYEMMDYRKDGSMFWSSMSAQAIRDENGKILYYEGAVEDVTPRKKAEAERDALIRELEGKNTELERFTYTVSHDLKSPLVTISGFLGFLEQDAQSGAMERLRQDVSRIQEAVHKMQRLLNELLELSRVGRLINPPETVPFESLAREAMEVVRGPLEGRGVTVWVQPGLPVVRGDRPRLVQALQNLLENAVKYSGENPAPRVEIGQRG
ncbi:MAG: PAS domain S-box protein, partial [Chloroflexota bacterium]